MIEINCQNYLNQYLTKKISFEHKDGAKNLMLIVETRLSLNLILVIKNAIEKLPNFNLMLISTKPIIEYVQNIFGKISCTFLFGFSVIFKYDLKKPKPYPKNCIIVVIIEINPTIKLNL